MAVYVYSEQQIERMVGKSRRLRIRICVAAIVILVMAVLLALYRPTLPIFHEPFRAWGIALLTSLFLFLVKTIWRWSEWPDVMRNSLRETRVEVASGSVGVSGPLGYKRQIGISDIVRVSGRQGSDTAYSLFGLGCRGHLRTRLFRGHLVA